MKKKTSSKPQTIARLGKIWQCVTENQPRGLGLHVEIEELQSRVM